VNRPYFLVLLAAWSAPALAEDASAAFDPLADAALAAERFVEVENGENLAGIRRVVIPSFMVEYVTEAKAETLINGIAMFAGAPSNASIKLVGAARGRGQGRQGHVPLGPGLAALLYERDRLHPEVRG